MAVDLREPVLASARAGAWQRWSARRRERAEAAVVRVAGERAQALRQVGACLERATALLERGWAQGRWYVVDVPPRRWPLALSLPARGTVTGACLVGAVVQAAGEGPGAGSDLRRTVDVLWEVLELPGHPDLPAFRRVCSPAERAGRVHRLTSWNDSPARTRQQVLGLVEAARTRALAAARG